MSIELLRRVGDLVRRSKFSIINLDSTVILERPRIGLYISDMKKVISETLNLGDGRMSIKVTTKEALDSIGRGQGGGAFTTVLVYRQGD